MGSQNFRSTYERRVWESLDGLSLPASVEVEYEPEVLRYEVTHKYTPDFVLRGVRGTIYIEAKGYFKPEDRSKSLTVRSQYPTISLRFLFQNPHVRLSSSSTTTYAQWCDKKGFLWAAGPEIPQAWIEEVE